jgi:flavin-dependent dehydrogenase
VEQNLTASSKPGIAETTSRVWDVIVIGAGPAGAVAARQLALQGLQTLLVERQSWPRIKVCGGCLNGHTLSILKSIGLEQVLEHSHAAPLTQMIVQARQRRAEINLPTGVAVNRAEFDAALVEAAVQAGVSFLPATKATVAVQTKASDLRQVTLSSNNQCGQLATARVVIAADGLGHPSLKSLPEFSCRVAEGSRLGLSATVEQLPLSYRAGAIYMAISRFGYVGLVRTKDGRGNLAAALDLTAMKSAVDPAQVVRSILQDAGLPAPMLPESTGWRGTIPLTRQTNRLSSHRVLLLGDAAGYAEPFTGEGVGWALGSAVAATPVVASNLDRWNPESVYEWEIAQKQKMQRGQTVCRALAYLLRRPTVVHLALGALRAIPSLASPLLRQVHQSNPNFGPPLTRLTATRLT